MFAPMPETVLLYRVLWASPGDVVEEYRIAAGLISEWNEQHGQLARTRLELMNWRSHSHPEAGARPQALINRQFADRADILIAVFWRRFGSPTGKVGSRTEEEIRRALKKRKPVMVYFSGRSDIKRSPSAERQRLKVEEFKSKFGRHALYGSYTEISGFEKELRKDLAYLMNGLLKGKPNKQ